VFEIWQTVSIGGREATRTIFVGRELAAEERRYAEHQEEPRADPLLLDLLCVL
jgi:hypothetical protein